MVDRIVTGYLRNEIAEYNKRLGYEDNLLDTAEIFHLWVIEGMNGYEKELPLDRLGYNVIFTKDITPYKTRKVRVINGTLTKNEQFGYKEIAIFKNGVTL